MELLKNLEGLSADEQMSAVVELQKAAMKTLEDQKQASIGKSAELVIQGLKKIKSDFEAKFDSLNYDIQTKVASLKDGEQGLQGPKGEQGDRGLDGSNGRDGRDGKDGKDGLDGVDGVGVRDAKIDFDGSLVITLSDGREINVGEVVPVDVAEKIRTVHNIQSGSGGDSQTVLDAIAALQATIATYGTMATQNANNVAITGGTINNTTIGATTPSTGVFTTLGVTTSINASSGSANADLNVNSKGTGNVNIGTGNGTQFRVGDTFAGGTATNFYKAQGTAGGGVVLVADGASTNVQAYLASKGASPISFTTAGVGVEQMRVSHTASAVNYHQLTGSATGSGPVHSVAGSDTNIDLNLTTKGSGVVNLNTGAGTQVRIIDSGGTAVNRIHLQGQATGFLPIIASRGSDTNLGMSYSTQGTGAHDFYTAGTSFAQQVKIAHTASAVNYVQVTGAATGGRAIISMQGSDTNIPAGFYTKGSGSIDFRSYGGSNNQFVISGSAVAVNYFQANGSITGFGPVLSAQGSDTNINAVVQPKGTGALQAQQTDSTATGGNARGANAVDWQTLRSSAAQVANGAQSAVGGGQNNTSSGTASVVGGGYQNTASGLTSTVSGGAFNTASQTNTYIGGGTGNTVSNYGAVVSGGQSNTAGGFYNFVGTGFTNSGTSASAVTTQSATMNGTTAVTLAASNASIKVGQLITGTSITNFTYVAAISGTSLTLSQVASGSSTSTLSFYTPHGVVVGGGNNQATGAYSFIGGGGDAGTAANRNVASGDWSVVAGGQRNTASGLYSFVGGGTPNTASGAYSGIASGSSNTATGAGGFIGAGVSNVVNGTYSAIMGGYQGTTRGIGGYHAFPATINPLGFTVGVCQGGLLVIARETTNATAARLTSDATTTGGTTNQVILPNNSAYYFRGEVVSGVTGGGNTKGFFIEGVIKRGANAASTALVGTPTVTSNYADAGASAWTIAVTADTTNGGLAVTFTGQAGTTIRTVAQIRTTEVTF